MRTPNTISKAIENSNRPPAMRNAESEMPSVRNSQSPISAAPIRIAPAMTLARSATLLRGGARQAVGDDQKGRRQADRIDHDEQGQQRRNGEVERHGVPGDDGEADCASIT